MSDALFYIFAFLTLVFGFLVIANPFSRNPVTSAMFLVLTLGSLAGLFVLLHAFFLAAVQVLVYAGAVMVLFLFVIMLLDLRAEERRKIKVAGAVAAFISKSPSLMLDDVLSLAGSNPNGSTDLDRGESELKIKFHQDLADTLGGEVTFALDGPILPTPSWKIIAEVRDPNRLQSTIQQLVTDVNEHVHPPHQGIALGQESAGGLTYYTIRSLDATKAYAVTYTFTDGYIIMGPSRALIMNAIAIRQSGNSLAASSEFRNLLPLDEHANVSALLYQNLSPVIGPISQQLTPSQLQSLQQLAAETKPSVVCAYGEDNAISIASNSRFFGLDLNTLALSSLMKVVHPPGAGHGHQ